MLSESLLAQVPELKFDHITPDDGLPNGDINAILQDQKGFIWFCTWEGLIRHDGYNFISYKPDIRDSSSISSKLVYCVTEDPTGNLWVGTTHGLNFFDRKNEAFIHFKYEPENRQSLLSNWIIALAVDLNNNLWVGTDQGLSHIILDANRTPIDFHHYKHIPNNPNSLPNDQIMSLEVDHHNRVWVGTMGGLALIDGQGHLERITDWEGNINFEEYSITAILENHQKNVWIGTKGGKVFQWNRQEEKFISHQVIDRYSPQSDKYISAFCEDEMGNLWIGIFEQGLAIQTNDGATIEIPYDSETASSLKSKAVKSIYQDRSGVLWIGTGGAGFHKLDLYRKPFIHFKHSSDMPEGLSSNTVMCFAEDPLGRMWIGTKEGINVFHPQENTFVHYENQTGTINPLISDKIWSVFVDHDKGVVWLGGHYGLISVNLRQYSPTGKMEWIKGDLSAQFKHIPFMDPKLDAEKHQVRSILKDRRGRLWVGTYYGLYVLDTQNETLEILQHYLHDPNIPSSISDNIVISLLEDRKGDMWIGTRDGGLNYLPLDEKGKGEKFIRYMAKPIPNSLHNNEVAAIHEDLKGDMWIGTTGGGLHKLERKIVNEKSLATPSILHFGKKDGLVADEIFGILEDAHENLWLSTNRGIFKFDPKLPEGQRFKQFTRDHGLQGNMFFTGAYYKSTNGNMFFGGQQGFNVFHPDSIKENRYVPSVALTKLSIFNEKVLVGEKVKGIKVLTQPISKTSEIYLSHKANNFSLEFAALHYSSPENNRYAYQLEGYDNDWIYTDASRRYASYNNLKPGTYIFKVKASNADNVWNQSYSQLIVHMGTPPWKSWWAIGLYGLLLLGFLYTFRYYTLNKIKLENDLEIQRREHQKTRELNQMKLSFFTQISHEFRTPLTLIIGPVQELVDKGKKLNKKEICRHLNLINFNAQHLLRLIDQLLYFSKSEYGNMKLHTEQGDLIAFTHQVCDSFNYLAQKKGIHLDFQAQNEELFMWLDWDKMEKIFNNLLSNALKFTSKGGKIQLILSVRKNIQSSHLFAQNNVSQNIVSIEVKDTGIGIPAEEIGHIFNSFYQASTDDNNTYVGYGIGLVLTKKLIEMHQGSISVASQEGMGTTFKIQLPYSTSPPKSEKRTKMIENDVLSILQDSKDMEELALANTFATELSQKKVMDTPDKPILLIVDDNQDIRSYLKRYLEGRYQILEAENGQDGWQKAIKHIPTIVISDIMMPIMNGTDLCNRLKSDERTNHIPIILLTAKSAIEHKIKGLEDGADAYLTKPFHPKHLEVRVQKLIELRVKLREKYMNNVYAPDSNAQAPTEDEIFLAKVSAIIEEYLTDTDFKVIHLERKLGMSHMQLYRKLKALTNQSANEFIRTIRLKKAAKLLRSSHLNVNEVAYQVGFNSPSYFIKCFRKEFGTLPKAYSAEARKSQV